jgi:DNA primase
MSINIKAQQSNKTIDELKSKIKAISAEELAGKLQIKLTKTGHSLQGACPTGHPSSSNRCFSINTRKNYWHCFNCGAGGDNINLIKETLNLTFFEAVKWAAEKYNLGPVPSSGNFGFELTEEQKAEAKVARVRAILYEAAFEYANKNLYVLEGRRAYEYLIKERGYTDDNIKLTEFCAWPSDPEIKRHLLKEFPDAVKDINSLPLSGHFGDYFDVAFPYRNRHGKITGFVKRSVEPKGVEIVDKKTGEIHKDVRYDSTFEISKHDLFGLDKISKKLDELIIVEGYPDALYLKAIGINNIVAVGQGMMSKTHLEGLIANKVKYVTIMFDNDKEDPKTGIRSGIKNTEAAVRLILNNSDIVPFVLDPFKLSPSKDPDEYVRTFGIDQFKTLIKKRENGVMWVADRLLKKYDKNDVIELAKLRNDLLDLMVSTPDVTIHSAMIDLIQKEFNLNKKDVIDLFKSVKQEKNLKDFDNIVKSSASEKQRYFPFIEKNTSSYAYFDRTADSVHLGVTKDILSNILLSAQQRTPEIFPALKADFDVTVDVRYDLEKEMFNFFTPTEYMLLKKTEEFINPIKEFPHIYQLLNNLIPKYNERKRFINWLAGILQTRQKQQTAWVFKSDQGAGKNLMLSYILKPLFGDKQVTMVNDSQLASEFNPWLQNAILIAFNEIAHDNNTRNSVKSTIKTIITEDEVTINEKNVKNYTITNYVNCIFFSNEKIPVFVEDKDRRLNIVTAAGILRNYKWFSNDPEAFIEDLKKELPRFAQFLMNYKYDAQLAKTVIDNDDKKTLVNVGMNRYEEFAYHLKKQDINWFEENIQTNMFGPKVNILATDIEGKILKSKALELFINIYDQKYASLVDLGKKLKLYGIISYRNKKDDNHYYQW